MSRRTPHQICLFCLIISLQNERIVSNLIILWRYMIFVTTFHFLHSPDFYIIYIILLFRAAFIKQQCTFECTWSPPTPDNTAKPTLSPTTISQTHNHILLKLRELPEQYRITASIRHAIVEFVKGLIEKKMGYDLEILDVEWPGRLPSEPHSLPIDITAQGPTDVSQFSQPCILELRISEPRSFLLVNSRAIQKSARDVHKKKQRGRLVLEFSL